MKTLIAVLGFTLLVSPVLAGAITLNTAPMFTPQGQELGCSVLNSSRKTLIVGVSATAIDGTVLFSEDFTLGPGLGGGNETLPLNSTLFVYCSFTFNGSAKDIRGTAEVLNVDTGFPTAALPAS
jgi:hypothetical protein